MSNPSPSPQPGSVPPSRVPMANTTDNAERNLPLASHFIPGRSLPSLQFMRPVGAGSLQILDPSIFFLERSGEGDRFQHPRSPETSEPDFTDSPFFRAHTASSGQDTSTPSIPVSDPTEQSTSPAEAIQRSPLPSTDQSLPSTETSQRSPFPSPNLALESPEDAQQSPLPSPNPPVESSEDAQRSPFSSPNPPVESSEDAQRSPHSSTSQSIESSGDAQRSPFSSPNPPVGSSEDAQ
ncbi:MAG: hypothetical protein AB4042_15875, partial [Leptolyngbyaceae cyanobacterium]